MTPEQLNEIERLAKAATPGPWRVDGNGDIIQTNHVTRDVWFIPRKREDTEYTARMDPATTLAMVARIRELEETCRMLYGIAALFNRETDAVWVEVRDKALAVMGEKR